MENEKQINLYQSIQIRFFPSLYSPLFLFIFDPYAIQSEAYSKPHLHMAKPFIPEQTTQCDYKKIHRHDIIAKPYLYVMPPNGMNTKYL